MALTCTDIGKLVHPYLDGEFSDEDRTALDHHTTECGACRELVQYEMAFKAAMRAKLASPKAPSALRAKVRGSLDELDRLSEGEVQPARWLWLLPTSAMTAAAAAIALFFLVPSGSRSAMPATAVATQQHETSSTNPLIDNHRARAIPVTAANVDYVQRELSRQVGVRVRVPELSGVDRSATVARVANLRGRRSAHFSYVLRNEQTGSKYDLSVYIFDPAKVQLGAMTKRRVAGSEVLCSTERGSSTIIYTKNGVGYALVSDDMNEDQLVQLARVDLSR